MCTVTWEQSESGYRLLFNRDELVTREKALAPKIFESNGVKAIMPIDARAGGTWISTNSSGVSICLINNYGAEMRINSDSAPSRGKLVSAMAFATTPDEASKIFHDMNPQTFNPFDIFIFDPNGTPTRWRWNGIELSADTPAEQFAFSTGFDIAAVVENRRNLYHQWVAEEADLADYHRSHIPSASSYSVCMHREEAGTQSMSEVRINQDSVSFSYWPGPPCRTSALPRISTPRNHHG